MAEDVLDNPVHHSLTGAHRLLALTEGRVLRYPPDVSPFMAVPQDVTAQDWADLARLSGGGPVLLHQDPDAVPAEWHPVRRLTVVQMTGAHVQTGRRQLPLPYRAEVLGPDDADDMVRLAALTKPGPFERRTRELGTYLGVRDNGRLVAMAGERMKPGGWSEISAVCTAPAHRGRGLARALMEALVDAIRERGEQPFLHVVEGAPAAGLYEAMGFTARRTLLVSSYRPG
ncbi:GNAT family N-acetyltransferase [Streptomyces longwoodensis]|uniref:GNAT family N-acetyltransferase n=1 Tax=Streptomyces longwoodensis TaxID=68231 RepID=UPI0038253426